MAPVYIILINLSFDIAIVIKCQKDRHLIELGHLRGLQHLQKIIANTIKYGTVSVSQLTQAIQIPQIMFKRTVLQTITYLEYFFLHVGKQIHTGRHSAAQHLLNTEVFTADPLFLFRPLLCHFME